jgi:hypothetical protein
MTVPRTPPEPTDRLVQSPVFILSSIRSGSTLLRCILDTHSRICAPHELHLADLRVQLSSPYVRLAMDVLDLRTEEIEHLLWDRMLHRELVRSRKEVIVDKTPANLLRWERISECWPSARYIFLLRHPAHIVASVVAHRIKSDPERSADLVLHYIECLNNARQGLHGLTVRYEELTVDPARVTQEICDYLSVAWELEMLNYGKASHGPFIYGIGDFGQNIESGQILTTQVLPNNEEISDILKSACQAWGYLTDR